MKAHCENPLCESRSVKKVPVSVRKHGDQVRALCATCEEAYTWGVQHGRMPALKGALWILAVADSGIVAYAGVYSSQAGAEKGLVEYLREYEDYDGQDEPEHVRSWLEEHDERLSVEIVEQNA